MVSLQSADNALKSVYLGVVANQLNDKANPLLAKFKQTTNDVWGKEIRKLAPFGINGGIGAGTETGPLPAAAEHKYVQFVTDLKNLYGKIEISDKAMRASSNSAGAFVNLLNSEMESLIKASTFNFGRMLYGDGSGLLATVGEIDATTHEIKLDSVRNIMEGMVLDVYDADGVKDESASGYRVAYVDRANSAITLQGFAGEIEEDSTLYVQNSKGLEITGLGKIFNQSETLYGLTRASYKWLSPYTKTDAGAISDSLVQEAIDQMEEQSGSTIDFITCSANVRRLYQDYLSTYRRNIDVMNLEGGHKAISFNGIPLVVDRFVENDAMYLLNSKDFALHQLCDWKWLEGEDGRIIRQNANAATYAATLVKYVDLICDRPNGQAKISGIVAPTT